MRITMLRLVTLACVTLFCVKLGWADIPAPPVNQTIGMDDVAFGSLTEADCRVCHSSGLPDRHHLLYGQSIPPGSVVPYPDSDGDSVPDPDYVCLSCHDENFTVVRDCMACHTTSAHHTTPAALSGDCVSCHGDIVDNIGDGHYIPSYAPSMVTPSVKGGIGLPVNSRGKGAGACDYCHDSDVLSDPQILTNSQLHHGATTNCSLCHSAHGGLFSIRLCEGCHGPDSLHNIQADSPNPNNIGTLVVGGEDAGYGHVGRDAGPGDSDCWGCHGFAFASAPGTGPIIPTVFSSDRKVIDAGQDTPVTLTGSSFANMAGHTLYQSNVAMTAADGLSLTLVPDRLEDGALTVTIPGDTPAGNYDVRAVKSEFRSNPTVISIVPEVTISRATSTRRGTVIITGSGFGGYAAGSGTSVTTTTSTGWRRRRTSTILKARTLSWSDTRIVASFGKSPREVTVNSVFGADTSKVAKR